MREAKIKKRKPIPGRKKHPVWIKWCALAASLCLVAGIGASVLMNLRRAGINDGSNHSNGFWGNGDHTLLDAHREDFTQGLSTEAKAAFEGVPGVMEIYRTLDNEWFLADDLTDFSQILTSNPLYIVPGSARGIGGRAENSAYSVYTLDENGVPCWGGSVMPGNNIVTVPNTFSGLTYDIIEEDLAGIDYDDYIIVQSARLYTVFIWARCTDGEDMFVTYPARPEFVGLENRGCYTLKDIRRILTEAYRNP